MTHTPGPWACKPRQGIPGYCAYPPEDQGDLPVALIPINRRSHTEAEANARLIAAAPDMFEALRVIAYASDDAAIERAPFTWIKSARGIARAAIAKAMEGK